MSPTLCTDESILVPVSVDKIGIDVVRRWVAAELDPGLVETEDICVSVLADVLREPMVS